MCFKHDYRHFYSLYTAYEMSLLIIYKVLRHVMGLFTPLKVDSFVDSLQYFKKFTVNPKT